MTVRLDESGVIRLEGACPIEEADQLLALRSAHPGATIDWRDCDQAHSAVIQLLFVGQPTVIGPPASVFLSQMIQPMFSTQP